jgi:hypothetical protein
MYGLLVHPAREWQVIHDLPEEDQKRLLPYTILLALIPAVSWYIGATEFGWSVGGREAIRITSESALTLIGVFYLTMVFAVLFIGYAIHWMSHTYGAKSFPMKGMVIAGFAATPLFVAGAAGIYPVFWLTLLLSGLAVTYTVYLLYLGLPVMMDISKDQGFMYASAIVAVAMVVAVSIMVGTVLFWDLVSGPEFI